MNDIQDSWNNLNGNQVIDSFEKTWYEWSIDDTIEWCEFVLSCPGKGLNEDDDDYSDNSDSTDDEDEDEDETDDYKQEIINEEIDFNYVKSRLLLFGFKSKKDLPMLLKPFQFKRFGFKNKKDCKLLCKKTQQLIEKYPRKHKKSKKKAVNKNEQGLEGFVQDTNN